MRDLFVSTHRALNEYTSMNEKEHNKEDWIQPRKVNFTISSISPGEERDPHHNREIPIED